MADGAADEALESVRVGAKQVLLIAATGAVPAHRTSPDERPASRGMSGLPLHRRPGRGANGWRAPRPRSTRRVAYAEALAEGVAERSLQYSTTEGDPALRAAIADRLTARGLPTHAEELLVTSGSQQALTLIATVLLEPGDTVLVEEPSYLAALQAFRLAGAAVVPVPCDDDGLDPEAAAALAERHRARLLYTIPTFQNPTGRTLSTERREALVGSLAGGFWGLLVQALSIGTRE
ncbi:MAG TPA: PLP-dependent aminotransferase family protein [Thermoleophilaceae bacterium]|nr:PLP-dependent aminotransferase family protein [Thermoleophilaceae bacterium]